MQGHGSKYVGQLINAKKRFEQHARYPPTKMKNDVSKCKPFHMHFSLHIEYTTMRKYLVDKKEKKLIKKFKMNIRLGCNVLRGQVGKLNIID
jgi:hypothetical protein